VQVYIAIVAFAINLIVAAVLSVVFRAMKLRDGNDITRHSDYGADENDPKVAQIQREYPLAEPGTTV
jgi:SSS family solute:Na+ symporter